MHSSRPLDIYVIAIGGTGTAPLACLLQQLGHRVQGADGPLYPPMSELLAAAGIVPHVGYNPAHLDPRPDLVVVGNAVPSTNPEVREAERRGLPRLSMPEALSRFCLAARSPLVVAGTHGKTTTTAMAAWTYLECGADPGYLVGGLPLDLDRSFRLGGGPRFIVEGDEYNAAYFDRGPKFLHYAPDVAVLTSVEYDHADLYASHERLLAAYRALVATLPPDGLLVACGDSEAVREIAAGAPCETRLYGEGDENEVRPVDPVVFEATGCRRRVVGPEGEAVLDLRVPGRHNLANALAVWTAACHDGIDPAMAAGALNRFRGVARRLQEVATVGGVTIVDDFAHHPTAVSASISALRQRYPGRRLVVLYEPRSLSAGRRLFFDDYVEAFAAADVVLVAPVFHAAHLEVAERLDRRALAEELEELGVDAEAPETIEETRREALRLLRPGDVVSCMSCGSFDDTPRRLVGALETGGRTRVTPTTVG